MADPNQTLGNSAFERIKAMILDGTLESGAPLREKRFADRLGMSRTPVREAIRQLINEGLATRSASGTPTVSSVSLDEVMEVLHARSLLEYETAKKASNTRKSLEGLLDLRAQIGSFIEGPKPDSRAHSIVDARLHLEIAELAGSKLLIELIDGLKAKTRMFDQGYIPERLLPGCLEHLAIIDAITARTPDEAAAAMKRHLSNARAGIISHMHHPF